MKTRFKNFYYWLIGISAIIVTVYLIYCLFISIVPIDILNVKDSNHVQVLNEGKSVRKGEALKLHLSYCKYLPFNGTLYTYIINGLKQELPETEGTLEVGCSEINVSIRIPIEMQGGSDYRIERVSKYPVSPFSTVTETWKSEPFTITD